MRASQIVLAVFVAVFVCMAGRQARAETPIIVCATAGEECKPEIDESTKAFDLRFPKDLCGTASETFKLNLRSDDDAEEPREIGTCSKTPARPGVEPSEFRCNIPDGAGPQSGKLFVSPCQETRFIINIAGTPHVEGAPASSEEVTSIGFLPLSIWRETLTQLHLPLAGHRLGHYYDRRADVAVLFFDSEGTPYFPMLDVVDEDDDIFVAIVDKTERVKGIAVSVQGCNRPPVEPNIYGGGISAALAGVATGTAPVNKPPPVTIILKAFGKCAGAAAGGPQLVIKRGGTQHTATIPVNVLYRLAVGLAFGYDGTEQRSFNVRTAAGDTTPRVAESTDRIGAATLLYVSFYPAARDFRKSDFLLGQRAQIFVGTDTKALFESLIVGVGYELTQGLNVLVGWRALTKQPVLAEGTRLRNGSSYDGTAESLPTRERWEMGSIFLGAGLSSDLLTRLR